MVQLQKRVNLTVQKISSMVLALCKLHNFCFEKSNEVIDCPDDRDIANITMEGGLFLPRMDNNKDAFWECDYNAQSHGDRLDGLLDGGAHMDDHTIRGGNTGQTPICRATKFCNTANV
jgi:hypothetical protein